MADKLETARRIAEICTQLSLISSQALKMRLGQADVLSASQKIALSKLESELDNEVIELQAIGIAIIVEDSADSLNDIIAATKDISAFLASVKKIEKAIAVITEVVQLATAISAQNYKSALSVAKDISKTLKED